MNLNTLPKSWSDISIKKYINYLKTFDNTLDDFEKLIIRLSILTDMSYEEVSNIPLPEINKINKALDWVVTTEPNKELKDTFKIQGTEYKITLDATKLTGGQYASISTKIGKEGVNSFDILHDILASISLPLGVDIKDIEPSYYPKTAELFLNNLSIADAYPVGVFFCEVSKNLTQGIQDYLAKELKKTKNLQSKMIRDFISNGDGSQLLTTWLMEMEQNGITTGD